MLCSCNRDVSPQTGLSQGEKLLQACVTTTEARHLDRPGQLSEFEQESNTESQQESNTDSHSAQNKAHVARQSAAERGEEAPHSKGVSTVCCHVQSAVLMFYNEGI